MRVVDLAQARASASARGATEATVEGPFYRPGAPELALGSDIGAGVPGEPTLYTGRVTDCDGKPIAGALLDVWSSDGAGKYDVQLAEPAMKARGRFRSDAEGRYRFWSIRPVAYPVPDDGPVGAMMRATARSNFRPAHLHLQVSAPGHVTLTTHLFDAGSPLHRRGRGVRQARQPGRRVRRAPAGPGRRRPRDDRALPLRAFRRQARAGCGAERGRSAGQPLDALQLAGVDGVAQRRDRLVAREAAPPGEDDAARRHRLGERHVGDVRLRPRRAPRAAARPSRPCPRRPCT